MNRVMEVTETSKGVVPQGIVNPLELRAAVVRLRREVDALKSQLAAAEQRSKLPPMLRVEPGLTEFLDCSRSAAYDTIKQSGFPVIRVGRAIRIPTDALLRWIDAQAGTG